MTAAPGSALEAVKFVWACPARRRRSVLPLLVHGYLVLGLALVGITCSYMNLEASDLIYPASLLFVTIAAWSVWSWTAYAGEWTDVYCLFLFSTIAFNGGQIVLLVASLDTTPLLNGTFSAETMLRSIYLVTCCVACLHFGALVSHVGARRGHAIDTRSRQGFGNPAAIRWAGWLLVAVSIVPAYLTTREAITTVGLKGYSGLYQRQIAASFEATPSVLAGFLVPGCLLLLAGSNGRRLAIWTSLTLVLTHAGASLYLGGRAAGTTVLIAYAWLWTRCVGRLPKLGLGLCAGFLGLVVLPVIRLIRDLDVANRMSLPALANAWTSIDNPLRAILWELGASMSTVAHTLNLVPAVRQFDAGASYMYALLTVIPNVWADVHPTVAHGKVSAWLVRTVDPVTAANGGGLGYSFIAEAYLNFGWFGAPLVVLILGLLVGLFVRWGNRSMDRAKAGFLASALTVLLIYARSETIDLVRNGAWYALCPYLLALIWSRYGRARQ